MGCGLASSVSACSRSMKVSIKGDDKEIQRQLKRLAKKAGLINDEFIDYAAGVAQRTVVRNVQPFGPPSKKGKPKELGEGAVKTSVHNAFQIVKNNYTGTDLVTGMSEMHQLHQRARNSRGRVGHKRANRPKVKYALFHTYLATVIAKVGKAKGGFADRNGELGNARIPKWVTRHDGAGTSSKSKSDNVAEWRFANNQSHTKDGYVMGASQLRGILQGQNKTLKKSLEGKLRKLGKL